LPVTPAEIVAHAKALGVLLYLRGGELSYIGQTPPGWLSITREWLPAREAVIQWLKTPPWDHQTAVAKALADQSRRRALPCAHLGDLVDPRPACGCGPLYTCEVFGQCVLTGNTKAWKVCTGCDRYEGKGNGHDLSGVNGSDSGA
jgi:hypothetical protein